MALSGGGFRAALYGLGVVKYLAEAGLLDRLQVVSAVSGGSVAAAVLADRWPELHAAGFTVEAYEQLVERPVHEALATSNIRNAALGRWARRRMTPWARSRGSALGDHLADRLLQARRVVDLPPDLQVLLTSTDLASGLAFRVSQEFVGNWRYGYIEPPAELTVGQAVAASTAVPLLFPPQYLWTAAWDFKREPEELSLVDGGVYDNQGLEWFQGWNNRTPPTGARRADFLISADASGPFAMTRKRYGGLAAISRSRAIQYRQTQTTRSRWLFDHFDAEKERGLIVKAVAGPRSYRHVDGRPVEPELYKGALPASFVEPLAALRTDLDRFLLEESRLLSYHGYWSAHARMASIHPALAVPGQPDWQEYAELSDSDQKRLLRLLDTGRRRSLNRR